MAPRNNSTSADEALVAPESTDNIVSQLIQVAYDIEGNIANELEKRQANRRSLRDLDKQGVLTPEQSSWVKLFYKPRAPRTRSNTEEEIAA